jgi:hypothetical protein
MADEDRDPLVAIRDRGATLLEFTAASAFNEWLLDESERWQAFKTSVDVSSDPVGELGHLGASEVADEWKGLSDQLSRTVALNDEKVSNVAASGVGAALNEKLQSKNLVLSSTAAGQNLLRLHGVDPAAARVALSVMTGRNISRVTHPQNARALWRAVFYSVMEGSPDATGAAGRVEVALQSSERSAAEVATLESALRDAFSDAKRQIDEEALTRSKSLTMVLDDLGKQANLKLAAVDSDWSDLRATYDSKLALEAPRHYWNSRRVVHRVAASMWGAAAFAVVWLTAFKLLPEGAALLRAAHGRAVFPVLSPQPQSIWIYLPEIFQIGVIGFLVLWGLRFSLRQVAENLARLEEASQRVTMVETFLAFSNPSDGKQAVVGEADRAVIVQALFRASNPSPIDEAPPIHWIEDVLRKIRSSGSHN